MSSDLIDGNKKIFERIWKLVVKAADCKFTEFETPEDRKQIEKLNKDIHRLRNVQLSMVI